MSSTPRRRLVKEADGIIIELPRQPTAAALLALFLDFVGQVGNRDGAVVMHCVGVVVRRPDGERVACPCGRGCAPTLWYTLDQPDRILATLGDSVAVRAPPPLYAAWHPHAAPTHWHQLFSLVTNVHEDRSSAPSELGKAELSDEAQRKVAHKVTQRHTGLLAHVREAQHGF